MPQFRPHRGGLEESMAEVMEVNSIQDIVDYVEKTTPIPNIKFNIKVRKYGYDARIKWDTYIVTDQFGVIGFTDGPIGPIKEGE